MAKVINLNQEIFTVQESVKGNAQAIQYFINDRGCHICISHALDKDGYPRMRRGKVKRMNRYIWQLFNKQDIQQGMLVMHTCDNPNCVNAEHLKLGTHKENMADMKSKGRATGRSKTMKVFTDEEIYYIRFVSTESISDLAKYYGVHIDIIRKIKNNKTHKIVTKDFNLDKKIAV